MWWPFAVACFLHVIGNVHCVFPEVRPDNPEAVMNVSQMISYWGYPSEEYEVTTEDGYILTINRIPHGKTDGHHSGRRPVVFLQHGFLMSASCWITNLPNNSLGFLLADAGYDVWLGNSRGNVWSRKHEYLSLDSKEFWEFSFDEMARYDLPASIDYIVKKTGQKIYYVGHSQGTFIGFLAFSTLPKLAQKVKAFHALAPVFSIQHVRSLPFKLLFRLPKLLFKLLVGDKDILPETAISKFLATEVCNNEITGIICGKIVFSLFGFDPENLNMSRIDVYLSHSLQGTSSQNFVHYYQNFHDIRNVTRAFDWGTRKENLAHYNQPTPPRYTLLSMRVPTALWSGQRDLLADPEDVAILVPQIPNLIYHKTLPTYNHLDFVFGVNAPEDVYNGMIEMIKKTP
ncbi:gastric triacylglycerol lipase-like [Gracilinanus agilis]|uniref:gastric triacylglycerol lipase-like n=1 Tax=Gracilinanus agilis TaxID=191870 RepID=UPI001CFD8556|nr:gastric triacylglycerol lipase-like [Gracilinanus agilis]